MTRLKKGISMLIIFSGCLSISNAFAQGDNVYNLFVKYADLYNSGDFIGAEKCMLTVLESEQKVSLDYIIPAYNNLGLIKKSLGLYTEALNYYNKAENLAINKEEYYIILAWIYNNKSRIHTFQRSFSTAIEFLEKSVRIYQSFENKDISVLNSLSTAWLNLGIIYYEMRDYGPALENLERSARLKLANNLPETELTFLNLAKTYSQVDSIKKAEEYFTSCLKTIKIKFGENYYRMSEVYFGYGNYLYKTGKFAEALDAHTKALNICLQNYGNKHSLVALSYKQLADYYLARADYPAALGYYQKSLISVEPGFNDNDIFSNPEVDSSFLDIRLLDILKSKAIVLERFANEQNDHDLKIKAISKSLETIELSLDLIDRIRNNYPAEETRIYLTENEKETYLFGVHIASVLYSVKGESSLKSKIYSIAEKAKAAVLRNEIAENELLLYPAAVPNSAMTRRNKLAGNVAAYTRLINEESVKNSPDSNKISLWKDALFDMNREMEKMTDEINLEFPQYRELIQKTKPAGLTEIQKHLKKNESIVEYLLSNNYKEGKRVLYTFVITKDDLEFRETGLDSLFSKNAEIIRNSFRYHDNNNFREVTGALAYMYTNLIKPVEGLFAGKRLVIIPDEEIARMPFDAFLKDMPGSAQTDFEGLQYLIHSYSISYCYSSSLIYGNSFPLNRREEVLSFAPDYDKTDNPGNIPSLKGTGIEIESINRWFRGKMFEGNRATETNFRIAMQKPAVYHLAMHSISDSTDSRYSYLLFDSSTDTLEDGKLYNYEISLLRLKSPMVVLSACNSGTGTLYHGEGLMSLARGFILAGAESVIRTAWEVNDEISADIISRFYRHLSEGRYKDDALRLAMLGYLKESPPAYSDPYYWAAYEVLGHNAPVKRCLFTPAAIGMTLIISSVILILYFRRRKIFSARSL